MGGVVSKIFGGGSKPKVEQAPVINSDADRKAQDEAANEERRRASASGRASTFFTGALGDVSAPNLASKVLLGDGG